MALENEKLVQQIQSGIEETMNLEQLYLQNRSFIYQQARKYSSYADIDDLMQEAYFGMCEAVKNYRSDKQVKFITYLSYHLQNAFRRYIAENVRIKRLPNYMIERISKYQKIMADYQAKNCVPSDWTIRRSLGITEKQLGDLRQIISEDNCISTSDIIPDTENLTLEDSIPDPFDMEEYTLNKVARKQADSVIWRIVEGLDNQQSKVIIGRYKKSATLQDLAKQMNLSKERIRAIERKALSILRYKQEIKEIADVYGYMEYIGTGLGAFKRRGSCVEYAAIQHMEREEKIKALMQKITNRKDEIHAVLDRDDIRKGGE